MYRILLRATILLTVLVIATGTNAAESGFDHKPTPDDVIERLMQGNERFVKGQSKHPNTTAERLIQAGKENQGHHAIATVITCSDSRVPVERIFDVGVMDIFVVRVAGNVVRTDEAGSIEYGLAHVYTPVLVILGHTQCGAVNAVTQEATGHGHELERNIPPLISPILPAVEKTMVLHPDLHGSELIDQAIIANVWQGVEDLFRQSPATIALVEKEKVKIVGAIYNVATGNVTWLPQEKVSEILAEVKSDPSRPTEPLYKDRDQTKTNHTTVASETDELGRLQSNLTLLQQKIEKLDTEIGASLQSLAEKTKAEPELDQKIREFSQKLDHLTSQPKTLAGVDTGNITAEIDQKIKTGNAEINNKLSALENEVSSQVNGQVSSLRRLIYITLVVGLLALLVVFFLVRGAALSATRELAESQAELRHKTKEALRRLSQEIRH